VLPQRQSDVAEGRQGEGSDQKYQHWPHYMERCAGAQVGERGRCGIVRAFEMCKKTQNELGEQEICLAEINPGRGCQWTRWMRCDQ
jgi:hypothetical protein